MKEKIINILLIEDEEAHAELARRAFDRYPEKYQLNIVGTLSQARLILAESPPDIVISDMKLPDGNSIELLPGSIEQAEVPFIIITSCGDERAAVTVMKKGALDYVPKSKDMFANMPQIIERSLREWINIVERKQAEIELAKYRDNLEELVEERTAELAIAKEKAEEASRAKSEFLSNMSHEIRTPMNAILGFAEVLKGKNKEPYLTEYIDTIYSSGKSLLSLINDILDLSKVEARKLTLEYSAVSLQSIFNEIRDTFAQKIKSKGLELVIDIPPELPKLLMLDEIRLRQILVNLVGNAVKFTDTGGIWLSADYIYPDKIQHSTIDLIFSVKDSGKGIPQDQYKYIFGAFSQVKGQKNKQYSGTGLGLAITQRLLGVMGGQITVSSEVGKGSAFNVVIKSVEVAAADLKETSADEIDIDSIRFEKSTILIVDDFEVNRKIIEEFLSDYDLKLLQAENGKEALDITKKHHLDLILLDMKMPVMDGYEVSAILNKDNELNKIPLIALTASAMAQDQLEIEKLCDLYLSKPFNKSDLISALMKLLPYTLVNKDVGDESLGKSSDKSEGDMAIPSVEEMDVLYDLAMQGNMSEVLDYANYLDQHNEQYNHFTCKLREMAKSYSDEELLTFVKESLDKINNQRL